MVGLLFLLQVVGSTGLNKQDIVTEAKFTSTDYYQIMDSFIKGLGADQTYTEEKNCQDKFSLLLDDYYYLNVNRTASTAMVVNN